MTEKLYEQSPYIREFEAIVQTCEEKKEKFYIELDRTAFFPEGGGQPGDHGKIDTVCILDTIEKDGQILHVADGPLKVGQVVHGAIDWNFRYTNMQNHAGEHIISGLIHQKYGYDNVGFHMGSEAITLDINGDLSEKQVEEIEIEANKAIQENIPILATIPEKSVLASMNYRSKKEIDGDVRIVEIPGYDCCACCGTHPMKTGEIHLIKILSVQNYKSGVRISMLAGNRALEDYNQKHENVVQISHLLSSKTGEVAEAVERLQKENNELKSSLSILKKKIMSMKAEKIAEGTPAVCVYEEDLIGNEVRDYANMLAEKCGRVLVLSGKDFESLRYVLIDNAEKAREYGSEIQKTFHGKGGGSPKMVQGTLSGSPETLCEWFENML